MQPQWGVAAMVRSYHYTHTQPQWHSDACASAQPSSSSPSSSTAAAASVATVVYPSTLGRALLCARCHVSWSQCSCMRCHVCDGAVGRATRHHCRQCDQPVCDGCWNALRHTRVGSAAVRVCDVCALRWGLAQLSVYATGAAADADADDKNTANNDVDRSDMRTATTTATRRAGGLLWGVYVLHCVAELPSRCAVPSCATMTYLPTCYMCRAPTVFMQPHVRRSVRVARGSAVVAETLRSLDARERWRRAQAVAAYTRADVDRLFALCYRHVPRHGEGGVAACGGAGAARDAAHTHRDRHGADDEARLFRKSGGSAGETRVLLLAAVASALAYEYARAPSLSLSLSDVPYARLLAVVESSPRYTVFAAPGGVRYIAFPGTHNWRTACVNAQLAHVAVDVAVPLVDGVVVGDDGVARVLHGGVRHVWHYATHTGYASEARDVGVDVAALLQDMRTRGHRVVLCGHSLGGAVAQLVALDLLHMSGAWLFAPQQQQQQQQEGQQQQHNNNDNDKDKVPRVMCVTFGAPLHANDALACMVRERGWQGCFHNVVYRDDCVPRLACATSSAQDTLRGVLERATGVVESVQSWLTTWRSHTSTSSSSSTAAAAAAQRVARYMRACEAVDKEMTVSRDGAAATRTTTTSSSSPVRQGDKDDGSDNKDRNGDGNGDDVALTSLVRATLLGSTAADDTEDDDDEDDDDDATTAVGNTADGEGDVRGDMRHSWQQRLRDDVAAAAATCMRSYTQSSQPPAPRRDYACLGRYYFFCYGDAGYVSTDDAAYAFALLTTAVRSRQAMLQDHRMVSYYRALVQHLNVHSCHMSRAATSASPLPRSRCASVGATTAHDARDNTKRRNSEDGDDDHIADDAAAQLYAQALCDYQAGALHACRDGVEAVLQLLADEQAHEQQQRQRRQHHRQTSSPAGAASSSTSSSHVLFVDALLLLSCVCAATHAYADAERLLVTCDGYAREHLRTPHMTHATIAYNRAVLRLERLAVRVQQTRLLSSTARNDNDDDENTTTTATVADKARSTHADRCSSHSKAATAATRNTTTTTTSAVRPLLAMSAQEVCEVHFARDVLLARALALLQGVSGLQRLLLADVWHTRGVCCALVGDAVAALDDWQRSLATRLRCGDAAGVTTLRLALTLEHIAHVEWLLGGALHDEGEVSSHGCSSGCSSGSASAAPLRLLALVAQTRRGLLGCAHDMYAATLLSQGVLLCERGHTQAAYTSLQRAAHTCAQQQQQQRDEPAATATTTATRALLTRDVQAWLTYTQTRLLQYAARSSAT